MALQKTKVLDNGVSGNYWKITSIEIDKMQMTAFVILCLFTDEAHKNTTPIAPNKNFSFIYTSQDVLGNVIQIAYDKIKLVIINDEDLSGAVDV